MALRIHLSALALVGLLSGCDTSHLTPEQRETRRITALMLLTGQLQSYGAGQASLAASYAQQPRPVMTCMPVNRYAAGSAVSCY